MPYGNIGDASNNNHKQLHHSIGLSDPKTVFVYYNLVFLQLYKLLWFGIAGTECTTRLKSVTVYYFDDLFTSLLLS